MKHLLTILFFLLTVQMSFAQSQKTFVKSLTADAATVVVDLEGQTAVNEWNENFIRVITTVELTNSSEEILKRLVAVGRYSLESETIDGVMTLTMPKLATKVNVKGELLNEIVQYEIFVPQGLSVTVKTHNSPQASVN